MATQFIRNCVMYWHFFPYAVLEEVITLIDLSFLFFI